MFTRKGQQGSDQHQFNSDLPPAYDGPGNEGYAPPPGPPPSQYDGPGNEGYAPPPGPPPLHQQPSEPDPPPYDPWLAVPDSTLLPPPPSIREERSTTSNASTDDSERAHAWCLRNPLLAPRHLNQQSLGRISNGDIRLTTPPNAKHVQVNQTGVGKTRVKTSSRCTDTPLLSDVPLYSAMSGRSRTLYYEVKVLSLGSHSAFRREEADASIAIGFLAPPYPSWRQPGWHRASLGVHGDDGRRYIDDCFGGLEFTTAFGKNDVVGIGMTFSPPIYAGGKKRCEIFFTRNGKREGGWDLHEERDREHDDGNVFGLEGEHDLLGVVGCFGAVEFETRFRSDDWMLKDKL